METAYPPRSPRFDVPPAPSGVDSGLAEWTSKIKAMQRQVDADEETEQRRLEEEIVRSRMARMRRSRGGKSMDLGLGSNGELASDLSSTHHANIENNPAKSSEEEEADAIHKLTGESQTRIPVSLSQRSAALPSRVPPSTALKPAPISLAAFIGGRATGPRLNKQTSQPDAHDPTLFEQRDYRNIAPHHVFGRGGIAMPGLVGKGRGGAEMVSSVVSGPAVVNPRADETAFTRERTISTTSGVARRYTEKLEDQAQAQKQTTPGLGISERRVSTPGPSGLAPSQGTSVQRAQTTIVSSGPSLPVSQSLREERRAKTPTTERAKTPLSDIQGNVAISENRTKTPILSGRRTPTQSIKTPPSSPPPDTRPWASRPISQSIPSSSSLSVHSPSPKVPVILPTPSLARPIQPTARPSPQGPQFPQRVSAAFLRAPPSPSAKDPTPSISRLQGRGFVQSVVQASGRLESVNTGSPSLSRLSTGIHEIKDKERRKSVLDRWPPAVGNAGAELDSFSTSPKAVPLRKSYTMNPTSLQPSDVDDRPVKSHDTGRSLKSSTSMPSISQVAQTASSKSRPVPVNGDDGDAPGLGSSSTMISYIKPLKTGENPLPDVEDASGADIDELGMRSSVGPGARKSHTPTEKSLLGSPSPLPGKPLSHPTKDRAKKPRKAKVLNEPLDTQHGQVLPSRAQVVEKKSNTSLISKTSVQLHHPSSAVPRVEESRSASVNQHHNIHSSPRQDQSSSGPITGRWGGQPIIGVKPISPGGIVAHSPASPSGSASRRFALPGLAAKPSVTVQSNTVQKNDESSVLSGRQRMPSTGDRALSTDGLQVSGNHDNRPMHDIAGSLSGSVVSDKTIPSIVERPSDPEKKKTSFGKHPTAMMPKLPEESASSRKNTLSSIATVPPSMHTPLLGYAGSSNLVHLDQVDSQLPSVDVQKLLTTNIYNFQPATDVQTVSTEVMTITGSTAMAIRSNPDIFYDTEILAIIHRTEFQTTGLANTAVWGWRGMNSQMGLREERKLLDLAQRYGAELVLIDQYQEEAELVHAVGGRLAIRQGSRAHWSSENTTMHVVRYLRGGIFIDELELNARNLCSGFSYCLSILDNIYVWYGCGSPAAERKAALAYAESFAVKGSQVIELLEGESDNDEMFWTILGGATYAKAEYWKWRNKSPPLDPRCWQMNIEKANEPISPLLCLSCATDVQTSVHILDCVWEFFILVGVEARPKKQDVKLAINVAMEMSKCVAGSRPFAPTVHVLILPTQLPLDLRLSFRDLDENKLNNNSVPDHMNILSTSEAYAKLNKAIW